MASVSNRGDLRVNQVIPIRNSNRNNRERDNRNGDSRNNNWKRDWDNQNDRDYGNRGNRGHRQPQRRYDYPTNRNHRSPHYGNGARQGQAKVFNRTIRMMRNTPYQNERRNIAKRYVRNNPVYAHQVARMMQNMRFEADRLWLAKYAFRFTRDKRNYREVRRELRFRSSQRELARFIGYRH